MYFGTFDPYDDNYDIFLREINQKENIMPDNNECIICWSQSTELNEVYYLNFVNYINKPCRCNVSIHDSCLRAWIKQSNSCPICRSEIQLLDMTIIEINEEPIYVSYMFLQQYIKILSIFFSYFFFLQITILYILIINQKINDNLLLVI